MQESERIVNYLWQNGTHEAFGYDFCRSIAVLPARADDGAASIAAGGLVLMKREPRITMAKEVLQISPTKVVVDYDFRNDSDQDITTAVAFPIAPYTWNQYFWAHEEAFSGAGSKPSESRINSFKLWVNRLSVHYQISATAMLQGRDYGPELRAMHIDPATFGHIAEGDERPDDFAKLLPEQRNELVKLGLIKGTDYSSPQWKAVTKYYWQQSFPAHQSVHIRHEYIPIAGQTQIPLDYMPGKQITNGGEDTARGVREVIASTCLPAHKAAEIAKVIESRPARDTKNMNSEESNREYFSHLLILDYVDFILTTANTWKQPIEDFTLIVNPKPYITEPAAKVYFCPDTSMGGANGTATTFHARNFTPTRELRIGFYRY